MSDVSTPDDVKAETVPLPDEAKDDAPQDSASQDSPSEPEPDTRCYITYFDEDGAHRVLLSEYDPAAH